MDDGEVELSAPDFLPNLSSSNATAGGSTSVDSFIDEYLKNSTRTCTHTHTCNPPGPDAAHTHTCYHTHTQVISSPEDTKAHYDTPSLKPRRPLGNREAVRKYREKKKAHIANLENEVKKLRAINQELIRKLQRQAILEAEVLRLRTLLLDLRGKIDMLGCTPYQKHCNSDNTSSFNEYDRGIHSAGNVGAVGFQCQGEIPCFQSRVNPSMRAVNGGDAC